MDAGYLKLSRAKLVAVFGSDGNKEEPTLSSFSPLSDCCVVPLVLLSASLAASSDS